jgi:hypothetical protein
MRIFGIHGIGQAYVGPEGLKQRWLPALRDGLAAADCPMAKGIDLEVIAYGDLFRPGETRSGGAPLIDPAELDDWERDMLVAWWHEASTLSAESLGAEKDESPEIQGPDFDGRARTPQAAQRALRQLAKSRFFSALGPQRLLLFGLRQVRLFLHDQEIKQAVLARVSRAIPPDPCIIVAHSLGSIVAYEALCANPNWRVHTLITAGSPLGIRRLVFDVLTPDPVGSRGVWPRVRRWVNVADTGDIVALEKKLAPLFGSDVEDHVVYNGWHSHDATRYLSSGITGRAIVDALKGEPGD